MPAWTAELTIPLSIPYIYASGTELRIIIDE